MKDKELEEQIRDISFGAISEMLDNPDSLGIYPTTKAFKRIEREVLDLIAEERLKAYDQGYADGYLSWENKKNEETRIDAINLNKAIKNLAELKEDKERKQ